MALRSSFIFLRAIPLILDLVLNYKEMMKLRIATIPRLILILVLALCPVFLSGALGQGQRGEQEPQA